MRRDSTDSGLLVDRVDPSHIFRLFYRLYIQIDHDRLLAGANQDAFQCFVSAGIDFLVRHIRWNENEVPWPGLGGIFEGFAQRMRALPFTT